MSQPLIKPCHIKTDKAKVFIQGPGAFSYIRMFYDWGFEGTTTIGEADLVCFTGGEDVDPDLYSEKALPRTHFNTARDKDDIACFGMARSMQLFMVGVCRGAQFLNVMNEGTLWQDVNGHLGSHPVLDLETGQWVDCTSTHHQQMIMGDTGTLVANCYRSDKKESEGRYWSSKSAPNDPMGEDAEVVWYEDTECLCFQPHPEFSPGACQNYFFSLLEVAGGFRGRRKD